MIDVKTSADFEPKMESYPAPARAHLARLRELVRDVASQTDEVTELEETLKWGEPSYLTPIGATVRMDWKERAPGEVALYFKCTSKLVETFRDIFGDKLQFEGSRAVVLPLDLDLPEDELRICIDLALRYHRVKHLPRLGVAIGD